MSLKLGLDGKLYYKAGGRAVAGDWAEISNARDVNLNLEKGEADVTTRGSGGWKQAKGTLKDASIEFDIIWDPADAAFAALLDAFLHNSVIGIACMDGDIASGDGFQASCDVMSFSRNEPLNDAMSAKVTVKPTYVANEAPIWLESGAEYTPTA